jgi:hypothetical protein
MLKLIGALVALLMLTDAVYAGEDPVASGVAGALIYDQKCEKLPKAFIDAMLAMPVSPQALEKATKESQEAYDISPKLLCRLYKPIVEKAMADTYAVWHR